MKLKFNYKKIKIKKKNKIKHRFNHISIFFDWTYFKQIEIRILNPFIKRRWKEVDKRMNVELLKGSGRKKNKIKHTNLYRLFNFVLIYIKIEIMQKTEYRKILKRMGMLK